MAENGDLEQLKHFMMSIVIIIAHMLALNNDLNTLNELNKPRGQHGRCL